VAPQPVVGRDPSVRAAAVELVAPLVIGFVV
jgi:hypothetical protein